MDFISATGEYTEYYVTTVDKSGQESVPSEIAIFDITIGINETLPTIFQQVFPNPTSGLLTISLEIKQAGNYDISIFSVDGRKLKSLYNGKYITGSQAIHWDGTNDKGNLAQNGIYFLTIKGAGINANQKIKYMVSIRCKLLVKSELDKLGLHYLKVELGEVNIKENLTDEQRDQLKTELLKSGLELMDDKKAILIEKVKNVIVEMVHYSEEVPKIIFLISSVKSSTRTIPTSPTFFQK